MALRGFGSVVATFLPTPPPIPKVALAPILVVIFGTNEMPRVAAFALSVACAIVAEFVDADQGLGYLIVTSIAFFKVPIT